MRHGHQAWTLDIGHGHAADQRAVNGIFCTHVLLALRVSKNQKDCGCKGADSPRGNRQGAQESMNFGVCNGGKDARAPSCRNGNSMVGCAVNLVLKFMMRIQGQSFERYLKRVNDAVEEALQETGAEQVEFQESCILWFLINGPSACTHFTVPHDHASRTPPLTVPPISLHSALVSKLNKAFCQNVCHDCTRDVWLILRTKFQLSRKSTSIFCKSARLHSNNPTSRGLATYEEVGAYRIS
eukprot:scaffold210725_cov19-Tisochrysis_lutea.AAC.1